MTFRLSTIAPVSKKNRSKILRIGSRGRCRSCGQSIGGKTIVSPSDEAREDAKEITRDAHAALVEMPRWQKSLTGLLYPSQELAVTAVVNMRAKRMHVEIDPVGERPKGFTGRSRDVHSHIDVLADALEGVVYANDNQISQWFLMRELGE